MFSSESEFFHDKKYLPRTRNFKLCRYYFVDGMIIIILCKPLYVFVTTLCEGDAVVSIFE